MRSKLFVHRVGRVARAGRSGNAYSFVAGDELAYFVDLQLFLGNTIQFAGDRNFQQILRSSKLSLFLIIISYSGPQTTVENWHNVIGSVPQSCYDDYGDQLRKWHESNLDLATLVRTASNG